MLISSHGNEKNSSFKYRTVKCFSVQLECYHAFTSQFLPDCSGESLGHYLASGDDHLDQTAPGHTGKNEPVASPKLFYGGCNNLNIKIPTVSDQAMVIHKKILQNKRVLLENLKQNLKKLYAVK